MPLRPVPALAGDGGEPRAPVGPGRIGDFLLAGHLVQHQVHQLCLGRHIGVERHGREPQRLAHPTHGERRQAFGVGDGDGRTDHLVH